MKKLLAAICAVTTASLLSAELYKPNRIVEFGVETGVGVSNNYFCLPDYLKEEIVFDLKDIADTMAGDGMIIDLYSTSRTFLNINVNEKFRLGFFSGLEASGYINIAEDLFKVLGKGVSIGETQNFQIEGYGDIFATSGISFQTKYRDYGIKIIPTFFMPVLYVANATASVKAVNNSDGSIEVRADAPLDVYTAIDMENIDDEEFTADKLNELFKTGGFDLTLEVEKQVRKTVDVGLFTRIPIIPGRMKHKMTAHMYAYYVENGFLNYMSEDESHETDHGVDDIVYSSASFKVHRPFRLGAEAAWRPFGKWMTFRPELAIAVRNPYSSEMTFYPEYALSATFSLFNILGLTAATGYQNRVFVQTLSLMLNARVLEIDAGASLRGANFSRSFNYSGLGAYIAVKAGF
ncbi:MAG: hypothetical protein K6G80_09675 [Treponema sp.]|nr:hypothetical protein [Treponema sp.]